MAPHLPSVVARLGQTQYPEAYGGMTVRLTAAGALTMTIYVVVARAEPFLAAVREQSAGTTEYAVVHVPHTWTELDALARKIDDAKAQWRSRGIRLGTAEPDPAASKVIITLKPFDPNAVSALTAAYGADWISVTPSTARYVPLKGSVS